MIDRKTLIADLDGYFAKDANSGLGSFCMDPATLADELLGRYTLTKRAVAKNIYAIKFNGRVKGAIGVTYKLNTVVEAYSEDSAGNKLYEDYEHIHNVEMRKLKAPGEILINEDDYASCNSGETIELLYMDYDSLDLADDFGWEWSGSCESGNATADISCEQLPSSCTDEEDKAHRIKVFAKAKADLEAMGYAVGTY